MKVTQKALKELAENFFVEDITRYSQEKIKELEQMETYFYTIAWAESLYGCSGKLLQGKNTGKLYVIHARNSNLFMI